MANGNEESRGFWQVAITWVKEKPTTEILLVAILAAIGWLTKYAMDTAIPAHLKQIQTGYETLTAMHNAEVESITARHVDEVKDTNTAFEKATERIERAAVSQERLLREIFTEQKQQGREARERTELGRKSHVEIAQ